MREEKVLDHAAVGERADDGWQPNMEGTRRQKFDAALVLGLAGLSADVSRRIMMPCSKFHTESIMRKSKSDEAVGKRNGYR